MMASGVSLRVADIEKAPAPPTLDPEALQAWHMYKAGLKCILHTGRARVEGADHKKEFVANVGFKLNRRTQPGEAVYMGPAVSDNQTTLTVITSTETIEYFGLWKPRPGLLVSMLNDQLELVFVHEAQEQPAD